MPKKPTDEILISDSGVTKTNKRLKVSLFVFLCNVMTLILAILGVLAFIKGNF